MENMPLVEGTTVKLRGKEYILPTMGGKAYRVGNAFEKLGKIEEAIKESEVSGIKSLSPEIIGYLYELTTYAFQRNYPEINIDFVEDALGLDEVMDCFPLLVSQNKEKTEQGLRILAEKNDQKQSTKKER